MSYKLKLYYLYFLTNINSLNINENVKKSLLCFGVPIGGFLAIYLITKTNETKSEPKDKIDEIYENNINIKGTLSSRDKDTIINQIINNENSDLIKKKLIQLKKTEKTGLDKIDLEIEIIEKLQLNFNEIKNKIEEIKSEEEKIFQEEIQTQIKQKTIVFQDIIINCIKNSIKRLKSTILNILNIPESRYLNIFEKKIISLFENQL